MMSLPALRLNAGRATTGPHSQGSGVPVWIGKHKATRRTKPLFVNCNGCTTNSGNSVVENVNLGNAADPYYLITDAALK